MRWKKTSELKFVKTVPQNMNRNTLEAYARKARRDFIEAVTDRAAVYGLNPNGIEPISEVGDLAIIGTNAFPYDVAMPRRRLEEQIRLEGFEQVMEAVAYTWFNRFAALRYMEIHGYFEHGYRVLSHPDGQPYPEILDHADTVNLPGLDQKKAVELKLDGSKDEELYRLLLMAQCNSLHQAMPFLFERIGNETELLLPANLLHTDSIIRQMVENIDESAWNHIEVIGWLYQFYISEKKGQVIGKVVASKDIPAATQLFTPNWIVKYLIQNSLGAQWMATYPDSYLKGQMDYYIEPAEQSDGVKVQLANVIPTALDPEDLTLIDPACGSGHILVEAYDLLKAIYIERGYRQIDVARLILGQNLFGLDIDERAAQLTGFALMMKGRADDRMVFKRGLTLNVTAIKDSTGFDVDRLEQSMNLTDYKLSTSDLIQLKQLFEHASTFGSLIQVPDRIRSKLPAMKKLCEVTSQDLFVSYALTHLGALVRQVEMLSAQYDAVVANPPYMGSNYQIQLIKKFLKQHYRDYDKDLFSAFVDRNLAFCKPHGRLGFMTPFVWMFIGSYENLRIRLLDTEIINSLVQLEFSGFEGATVPICTFTLQKYHLSSHKGCFIRLSGFRGSDIQSSKTVEAIRNRNCGWFYETEQVEFKKFPGSRIAYWIRNTNPFAGLRIRHEFESGGRTKTHGNQMYLRYWWEVGSQTEYWAPYANGGDYRKYAGNILEVVNWSSGATKYYDSCGGLYPQKYWGKEGITWGLITSSISSFRLKPTEAHYSSGSPTIVTTRFLNNHVVLGFLNSPITHYYLAAMNPTVNTTVNDVLDLPLPLRSEFREIETNVGSCIEISQADWNAYERSKDYQSFPLLKDSSNNSLETCYNNWITQNHKIVSEMRCLEEKNNRDFIDAFNLQDELTSQVPIERVTLTVNPAYRYGGDLSNEAQWSRFRRDTMAELVSYAIGCIMGRYSLDNPGLIYAHSETEDFDPDNYTMFPADPDGIVPVTDLDWFGNDAIHRLIEFIATAWDATHLEENLAFLANNLSTKKNESSRETLRRYLCDRFFKDHLQTYKKRPIYWLFSSGKQKAFQCLVYLHRYNEGTLARMRTEYVVPLQGLMASRLRQLDTDITAAPSTVYRKRLERERETLVKKQPELREFDEKLRHYADQHIELDLDNGVRVNYGRFGSLLSEFKTVTGNKADR